MGDRKVCVQQSFTHKYAMKKMKRWKRKRMFLASVCYADALMFCMIFAVTLQTLHAFYREKGLELGSC